MSWCYSFIGSYGLSIVIFTVLCKIVLLPVSIWLQFDSIKMVKMQPEINRLKADFFGDYDTIYEEQSKIFKREHYSPFTSVIPMVIQLVLLLGVVAVIYHPLTYILHLPADVIGTLNAFVSGKLGLDPEISSIELYVVNFVQNAGGGELVSAEALSSIRGLNMTFLGFNLSFVPSRVGGATLLVPVIAGFSSWLMCFVQNRSNVLQAEQSKWNQYGMMAFSVGLSLYLGFFVPIGVGLYWVVSNLVSILQLYFLNFIINPKKYVDYEALEESRKRLEDLKTYGGGKKKKAGFFSQEARRERADRKRFFTYKNKHLVFYSESTGFYKYMGDVLEYVLKHSDITVHYVTSDPDDAVFERAKEFPHLEAYYVSPDKLIVFMMKMDADIVAMTMPDLDNYQIRRSVFRKDIEYIYMPHEIAGWNLQNRFGAVNNYDTILCVGKGQVEEARRTEELYGLPAKNLVECGYPLLDNMRNDYAESQKNRSRDAGSKEEAISAKSSGGAKKAPKILIAPSWQKDNIVDLCLEPLLDSLTGQGFKITVRPHPQQVKHQGDKMKELKERYEALGDIEIQTDFSKNSTVFEADLLITDWSAISFEYAFTTLRPVLFIDTPMKVMNPRHEELPGTPIEIWSREKLGRHLAPEQAKEAAAAVRELLERGEEYRGEIEALYREYIFNPGSAAEAGGKYLLKAIKRKIEERKTNKESS